MSVRRNSANWRWLSGIAVAKLFYFLFNIWAEIIRNYFSKILDINQCTMMNFDTKKLYYFIAVRFKRTPAKVQGQALSWLQVNVRSDFEFKIYEPRILKFVIWTYSQILTLLDITLPIHMLFSFFEDGINSLIETEGEYDEFIQQLNLPSRSTISEFFAIFKPLTPWIHIFSFDFPISIPHFTKTDKYLVWIFHYNDLERGGGTKSKIWLQIRVLHTNPSPPPHHTSPYTRFQ